MNCKVEVYSKFTSITDCVIPNGFIEAFKIYKSSNRKILPLEFGRDVLMSYPATLTKNNIRHMHIGKFRKNTPQNSRTSDTFLIYIKSLVNENRYLLICFITPDAHQRIKNNNVLNLLNKIADEYQESEFNRL